MVEEVPFQADRVKARLYDVLVRENPARSSLRVARNDHVCMDGGRGRSLYLIQQGKIKLLMLTPKGRECMLAIHTPGDIFGEFCFCGLSDVSVTATAMEDSLLTPIASQQLLVSLSKHCMLEMYVQYLAARIAEQQRLITNLMTADSEHLLGETLLLLAQKLGRPHDLSTKIEARISHEDLSKMVGTTRPRITELLQKFKSLGFVQLSDDRALVVKEKELSEYLHH